MQNVKNFKGVVILLGTKDYATKESNETIKSIKNVVSCVKKWPDVSFVFSSIKPRKGKSCNVKLIKKSAINIKKMEKLSFFRQSFFPF